MSSISCAKVSSWTKKYHDHNLSGNLSTFRECHIKPDWLLVYLIENDILTLTLVDTGSHSDIFKE
ncbi:type II toxin-antitoxin system YafQ family toxin [Bifidobacterium gallicum]|uniref:type II toxin-antitoxin system YafQ family toxin n=1 Tax=Bifidobacterium gallicum TaxID=78342 RepID=UPI0030828340